VGPVASRYETTVTLTISVTAPDEETARSLVDAAMSKLSGLRGRSLGRGVKVTYVDGGYEYDNMDGGHE
jgi:hypothetical protein